MNVDRRNLLARGLGLTAGAILPAAPALARALRTTTPEALNWSGPQMLEAFVKARSSLREEFTIGWVDASTYAIMNGETSPLYRLLAATWQRHKRTSDTRFDGQALEVAFYLDFKTGERLENLTMPRTGAVVTVPNYRAGPSANAIVVEDKQREDFSMASETKDGSSFFNSGASEREQYLSQPQRDAADFVIRQTLGTRVMTKGVDKPVFFYHEWTINRSPWREITNPKLVSATVEVQYSSIAAFRPWMQMKSVDGHTLQNGRGGKVSGPQALPPQLLQLCQRYHPDLLENPDKVFAAKKP
jgi:hypothetical protein